LRGLDISSGLSDLRMPVLICTGLYNFPGVDKVIDYQKLSPKSEFVTFINSAHFPMLEESEGFNMIIGDFLRRVEAEQESSPEHDLSGRALIFRLEMFRSARKTTGSIWYLEIGRVFSISTLPSSPGTVTPGGSKYSTEKRLELSPNHSTRTGTTAAPTRSFSSG
jgi:hypothetical protein